MMFLLWLFSCSTEQNGEKSNVVSQQEPKQQESKSSKDSSAKGEHKNELKKKLNLVSENIKQDILSPSPLETQKTVRTAGISTSLHEFVKVQKYNFEGNSREQAAIRVGVLLCDLIVSIDQASKEDIILRFSNIIEGMAVMKVGDGLMSMVKDMHTQYTNDAMTKQEIVEGLDNIAAMSVPEEGFSKDDPTGPLLQAGAWLEGVNLVSKAILKDDKIEVANKLLRLEHVATYFLQYANGEGKEKATEQILNQMKTSLTYLKTLAKKEKIEKSDLEQAITETEKMLSFL
jgi:hypothetical protein